MQVLTESSVWNSQQIEMIEKHYNARYVLETCLKSKHGGWCNFPAAIFYQDTPHPEGSNYFALYEKPDTGEVMITNALSSIQEPINALLIGGRDNGVVIYSRYRHDYRTHENFSVDGGRDYFRYGGDPLNEFKKVRLIVAEDKVLVTFDV